jgi:hypothetical protein
VVTCHYPVNELTIHFITKNSNRLTRSIKTSAPSSAQFFAQVIVTPFLKSWKGTCVHVPKMSAEMVSVSGAVVREKTGVKTVSEVQGSSNQGPPCN